jgi:ketosteroid isomerase-like protein
MEITVDRVVERGDEALAILDVTLVGRGSGVEMEDRIAQLWTIRDGRLARMKLYLDPESALAEFSRR